MIRKFFTLLVIIALSINSYSQNSTSSPYSFYGIGSLDFRGTTENRSMGRLSVYNDSIHMNFKNPASYTGKNLFIFNEEGRLVKFTVGLNYSETKLSSNNQNSLASNTSFDYLGLNLPMGKFGMALGLIPFSSVGYKLESSNDINLMKFKYEGFGGVNKAFLGFAYQISNNISIGFDAKYNFGNIQNSAIEFLYDDDNEPLDYQSKESNRSDLSGINFNFGLIYSGTIFNEYTLNATFAYSPSYDLSSINNRTFASVVINSISGLDFPINQIEVDLESLNLYKTDLVMPNRLNFGLGIGKEKKWFIGSEITTINSSVFSNDLINIENSRFEDSYLLSLGGFYIPDYASFNRFFDRIVYRTGVYFEKTGLNINDQSINEIGISFGLGIPAGGLFSNINTSFEFGRRGTKKANLIKETFTNIHISLSLNDRWFIKRKYN